MASAFADELKVDVISVPEICEEKSKAGDTVRLVSLLQLISPTPYFLLNIFLAKKVDSSAFALNFRV